MIIIIALAWTFIFLAIVTAKAVASVKIEPRPTDIRGHWIPNKP